MSRKAVPATVVAIFVSAVALALLSSLSLTLIGAAMLVLLVVVDAITHRPGTLGPGEPRTLIADLRRRRRP